MVSHRPGSMEEQLRERLARLVTNSSQAFNTLWTSIDHLGMRSDSDINSDCQFRFTKKDIENKLESQIKFQDNDHLFIESKDVKSLFLFNSSGQRQNPNFVLSTDNGISLTTSNLIGGIYYLQILHSSGQSEIIKFIKFHFFRKEGYYGNYCGIGK